MDEGPVQALAASIRRRELAVVDLVAESLGRLDRLSALHPVAWRDDTAVLDRASEADAALARGERVGPLHGVPITVKDWIDVSGFPCAGGDPAHRHRLPDRDASAVARLRSAGAIVIAKGNVGEQSSLYGTARNPWDPSRTPGHSTSGDAIAVATGASAIGVGSDSGGSLRFPAHCTGLAAIKPTLGRVPATGHFPPIDALTDGRTVIGPLCRSVSDLSLVLEIMAGPDGIDPDLPPVPFRNVAEARPLRILLHTDDAVVPIPDVTSMMRRVAQVLADERHQVTPSNALHPERALDITQRYWRRPLPTGAEHEKLLEDWQAFKRQAMKQLEHADLIVSSAAPYPAPRVGAASDTDWAYTLAPSLWGFPAAIVRCGASDDGLPLGVQVVARAWEETLALSLAETLESALGHESPMSFPAADGQSSRDAYG
jgi:amidase